MNRSKFFTKLALMAAALMTLGAVGCSDDDDNGNNPNNPTFTQVERMAIPAINTALIPSSMKDAFNTGEPKDDIANFRATGEATITALRTAVMPFLGAEDNPGVPAATLATVLIPDVVTIDFSQPVQFPNGRRLQDDVIDAALGLVLNRGDVLGGGAGVGDGINANEEAFLSTFPYLAAAH